MKPNKTKTTENSITQETAASLKSAQFFNDQNTVVSTVWGSQYKSGVPCNNYYQRLPWAAVWQHVILLSGRLLLYAPMLLAENRTLASHAQSKLQGNKWFCECN